VLCPFRGALGTRLIQWMKTPLGTEVDLGPGHIVFDGDAARLPAKGAQQPPPRSSAHVYCGHGRPSQLLLSSCSKFASVVRQVLCVCV